MLRIRRASTIEGLNDNRHDNGLSKGYLAFKGNVYEIIG